MTDTLKIEAGKEYLLRNGWRMRCYATDGEIPYPIHGAMFDQESEGWESACWSDGPDFEKCGKYPDADFDIISEAPKSIEVDCWLRIYDDGSRDVFDGPAVISSTLGPVAQIHIKRTILPGEGL